MSRREGAIHFPCPICKGRGGYKEIILDDGSGPYYPCDFCDDSGRIGVKSQKHRQLMAKKIMGCLWDKMEYLNLIAPGEEKSEAEKKLDAIGVMVGELLEIKPDDQPAPTPEAV